ncbi:MAG: AAA family ATPase [Pseudomonadota bacterium]
MTKNEERLPSPKELEKELSNYLSHKYGDRIKIISPMIVPQQVSFEEGDAEKEKPKGRKKINFSIKPEELEAFLDQYIVRQSAAKAVLATKICTHFNRIRYANQHTEDRDTIVGSIKNNILLIGPTGVGKTYIVKLIANKIGVPFVKCDATKFSETGYVGGDIEDIIRDLVREANEDIELAECGIVYLDEIDKIASSPNLIGPDVSRTGVQRALLKPMEETEVDLRTPHDPISMLQEIEHYRKTGKREKRIVNTKNILFIMSGAFNDLTEIIKKRTVDQGIGFGSTLANKDQTTDFLKHVKSEDMIKFGFESEFIGRTPVITIMERLSVNDLYEILRNPSNCVILNKKRDFIAYGIHLKFSDKALRLFAEKGYAEQTGARGLVSAIESVILPFEKKLPSTDIKRLAITEQAVESAERILQALLSNPSDEQWFKAFNEIETEEQVAVKEYIIKNKTNITEFHGLTLSMPQTELIAHIYTLHTMDVTGIIEQVKSVYTQLTQLEEYFLKSSGIRITLDEPARAYAAKSVVESKQTFSDIFKSLKQNFEYGLRLIQDKIGESAFVIPRKGLENPEQFLNELIKKHYGDQIAEDFTNRLNNKSGV